MSVVSEKNVCDLRLLGRRSNGLRCGAVQMLFGGWSPAESDLEVTFGADRTLAGDLGSRLLDRNLELLTSELCGLGSLHGSSDRVPEQWYARSDGGVAV
jgi:hypothetical protein